MQTQQAPRPSIEIPANTDVSWPGHRFSLRSAARSALSRLSAPAQGVSLLHDLAATLSAFNASKSERSFPKLTATRESNVPALAELGCYQTGKTSLMAVTQSGGVETLKILGVHGVGSTPVPPSQERCVL